MDTGTEVKKVILRINSSARWADSITRKLSDEVIGRLVNEHSLVEVVERDLNTGMSFIDEKWIEASFTDPQRRDASQAEKLSFSDELVAELKAADILVIAAPVYNFSIPASMKAWVDMVCRARETFRYSENGPEGLLKGKQAYLVMASGGVPFGSEMDFASGYLKQVLGFIGIDDVRPVYAEGLNTIGEHAQDSALEMLKQWLPENIAA